MTSKADAVHQMIGDVFEQIRCGNLSLSYSDVQRKAGGLLGANRYIAFSVAVHSLKESGELTGQDWPRSFQVGAVNGWLE